MAKKKQNNTQKKVRLSQVLVLNRYLLNLFGIRSLEAFTQEIKETRMEGYDENNVSNFYHFLHSRLYHNSALTSDMLYQYDQNIYSHTRKITEKRGTIQWKYFQYLALMFTEVYLDKYFNNKESLLNELNEYATSFNFELAQKDNSFVVEPFIDSDLNKLAFWNATGSGKTLLAHINILQYLHYLKKKGREKELNRIILLTPNEGLSVQHLQEFTLSNLRAEMFNKEGKSLFSGSTIEIIDIHKLEETQGEKTVAVDSFEGNNLVLVDEGHRGSSGDDWKDKRNRICEQGFSFEYSATFGQAVSAASGSKRTSLLQEYAKCTIFDYSYKYFHQDGYGKDFEILNLNETWNDATTNMYLTACLLSFYQQLAIYEDDKRGIPAFLIEKPLLVFVGSSVNAIRTENKKEVSDVIQILQFIGGFVKNETSSIDYIDRLLNGRDGLNDKNNHPIFLNSFKFFSEKRFMAEVLYKQILFGIFNSTISGAVLHLENLKGAEGEIGLRIGTSDYFGVINVGDDSKLLKLCEQAGISTTDKDFSDSLFHAINKPDSTVNVLVGSKKFTEGWSSWRVSTMGLMNVGKGEGSAVIQLFGRGVRLKGYNFSLKRSEYLDEETKPGFIPKYLTFIETLNVFGIRADYMQQFKEYLEDEGLDTGDTDDDNKYIQIDVPVLPTIELDKKKLKIIRVQEGIDFKTQTVNLYLPNDDSTVHVTLDWYPKLDRIQSARSRAISNIENLETGTLNTEHTAFLKWDDIYFEIQKFKNERNWYNLSFTKDIIKQLASINDWYTLYIPQDELKLTKFSQTQTWQEITTLLLKGYVDKVYNFEKNKYLSQYIESVVLDITHRNFEKEYSFYIKQSEESIIQKITELKELLIKDEFKKSLSFGPNSDVFYFSQHLYKPLVYFDKNTYQDLVKITPVQLNEGEKDLVKHLKDYYEKNPDFFADKELYLLRNLSRKGIGFFEANGFYPDFILWILHNDKQYVSFVDPKGLRQIEGLEHAKIKFHKTIKSSIESKLADKSIVLNSFIISSTPFKEIKHWKGQTDINGFNKHHVYFQKDQKETYIGLILQKSLNSLCGLLI